MTWWRELGSALSLLTILPIGGQYDGPPGRIFAWFPLVGLVVGTAVALLAWLPWPSPDLRAFVALAGWIGLTGGLHLDGFADSCDGLLATVPPEHRLEIMHDPRAGSWAVIGLVLLLLGKWITLQSVPFPLIVLPAILGRWSMTLAAWWFPVASQSVTGAHFRQGLGRPQMLIASLSTLLVTVPLVAALAWRATTLLGVVPLTTWGLGRWAAQRLGGGLTGDTYGALCELTELLCLTVLVFLH
jgi:adenosylcobinamide-GDP ribazoletransferase